MNVAVNTDYAGGLGCPEKRLANMARVGFTHVHWCHQWNTDFAYMEGEINQIKQWFKQYGLTLLDIHGSVGPEKNWFSPVEYQRQAGRELVANRMKMLRELDGTGTVMMHIPAFLSITSEVERPAILKKLDALRKSLDELMPLSRELNVPIAVENTAYDTFEIIETLLAEYPPEFLGLCYDSGHGHLFDNKGLDHLDHNKDRLMALHIHDNDGTGDLHQPPFYGTLEWERFASILKASPYPREISFEIGVKNTPFAENHEAFMDDAYARCLKFTKMVRG